MRQTVGDVLLLSQLELVETLDVPPGEAAALLRAAARSMLSAPVTVSKRPAGKELQPQCVSRSHREARYRAGECLLGRLGSGVGLGSCPSMPALLSRLWTQQHGCRREEVC